MYLVKYTQTIVFLIKKSSVVVIVVAGRTRPLTRLVGYTQTVARYIRKTSAVVDLGAEPLCRVEALHRDAPALQEERFQKLVQRSVIDGFAKEGIIHLVAVCVINIRFAITLEKVHITTIDIQPRF